MKRILLLSTILFTSLAYSQQNSDKWDLKRCVDYAMKNNISVKQAEIQARLSGLQLKSAQLQQYPNASGSSGLGMQFGRSIDPTTNQFVNTQLLYNSFGINAGINLYNWNKQKNSIKYYDYNAQANLADIERAANDIALNVATYYLAVLSSKQQMEIAEYQIQSTTAQLSTTRIKVDAGALPELNAVELESKLASDSLSYYNAQSSYQQNVLQLKALLNLDMAVPFNLELPPLDRIPLEPIASLEPNALYKLALTNQPTQKVNDLYLKASQYNIKVAKAAFYPTISFGGGLATNFASSGTKITGYTIGSPQPNGQFVTISGTDYYVKEYTYQVQQGHKNFGEFWEGYGSQLSNNFRQNVGFQISIPIFNNGNAKLGYEQAKLNYQNLEISKQRSDQKLQQDIYLAYNNAVTALQRLNAGQKTVESAQKAYDFAKKRYDIGLITTLDLITTQNNLVQAQLNKLSSQFEFVFRMKLLEYYKGQGLKFN